MTNIEIPTDPVRLVELIKEINVHIKESKSAFEKIDWYIYKSNLTDVLIKILQNSGKI